MSEDEQEIYATLVEIKQEPTELYKILKFANIVSGGGEAKQVISEGYVYLNGEVETRKRKKIYAGDLLYFNGQYFQIALQGAIDDYEIVAPQADQDGTEIKNENKQNRNKKARKPISF
jgi:ribosome-associated protein